MRPILKTTGAALKCPRCHDGVIQLVTDGFIGETYHPGYHVAGRPLPTRWRSAPFGACNACEFCIEVHMTTKARIAV